MTSPALTIVVGSDFSEASGFAFEHAARIAQRVPGSHVHVVHAIEGKASEERAKQLAQELRLFLQQRADAIGGLPRQSVGLHIRWGRAAREIAQLAKDTAADFIVVGTHAPPKEKKLTVGTVAEALLRAAPCPVYVAGPMPAAGDDAHEPAIEPACPDCIATRQSSGGKAWWCPRHAEHHVRAHAYSYQSELPFATHDSAVSPTGTDIEPK